MKGKKKQLRILVTLLLFLLMTSVPVSGASSVKIAKGGTKQLKLKGTTIKKAVSSKKSVATVTSQGKITAKKKGQTIITVTDKKNQKHKYIVTVEKPSLSKKAVTLKQGKTFTLQLKNNTQKVKWSSNKKKIATVSKKGKITAKLPGKAIITAKIPNGPIYKCTVTVKKVKPKLSALSADECNFRVNTKDTVTFTVKASASVTQKIKLYNTKGKSVAVMKDNGKNGDLKKNDGIFTCILKVQKSKVGSAAYYAKAGSLKTKKVKLYFYNAPTQNDQHDQDEVAEDFENIASKYEDSNGNISPSNVPKALSDVTDYAKQLCSKGEAVYYESNKDNVLCKLKSGLSVIYQPQIQGFDSIGSNVSMSVFSMQPCLSTYNSSLSSNMRLPDNAANAIAQEFSNYSFPSSNNLDNSAVSLDRIKSISSNQVVLWHGHGGYSKSLHSFLLTGEAFNWTKWWFDTNYWWDCVQDRIIKSSNGNVIITPKFINKYCGNMNNSFVYLAACQSGTDNVLANSFLNKGASAVVANSETIYTIYNTRIQNATIINMCTVNPNTRNYYTLSEALNRAKEQHGRDDGSEHHATPLIFGGTNASNYRFGDVKPGRIVGQVCRADDRSTPVANAAITIYHNNQNIQSLRADNSGNYTTQLNPGTYVLDIRADGFIGFQCYVTVVSNRDKYMETFLMVEGSEADPGIANGYIRNALTGAGVEAAKLEVRKNWNNPSVGQPVATVYTDSNGWYTLDLPLGNYTVTASKNGFVTNSFNIISLATSYMNQNGTISPAGSDDVYQIVLTWGNSPRDLDSHIVGTAASGNIFHTYFSSKSFRENGTEICNLDVDDTSSYGPETITLRVSNTAPYYYYIHQYSSDGNLPTSGAQIRVFRGGQLLDTYHVPTNQGTGRYWNVFSIIDGRIITKNTITSAADVSYASSNPEVQAMTLQAAQNTKAKK